MDFIRGVGTALGTGGGDGIDLNAEMGFLTIGPAGIEAGVTLEDRGVSSNFFSPFLTSFKTEGMTLVGLAMNLSSSVDGTRGILRILSDLGRLGLVLIGAVTTGTDDTGNGDDGSGREDGGGPGL